MTINIHRNPVSEIYAWGQETGFLRVFGWVSGNIERNPVSEVYAWGQETGFLRVFGWVSGNIERNPVSEIYGWGDKSYFQSLMLAIAETVISKICVFVKTFVTLRLLTSESINRTL